MIDLATAAASATVLSAGVRTALACSVDWRNRSHHARSLTNREHDWKSGIEQQLLSTFQSHREKLLTRSSWRTVVVERIESESLDTKSFYLRADDQARLPSFKPGQHVLVEAPLDPDEKPQYRCYSLSGLPTDGIWRITVKRADPSSESQATRHSVSAFLHDRVRTGDKLRVKGPQGSFVLDTASHEPVVLVAAGVGITPMWSMLHEALRLSDQRKVWLFYQVRDPQHAPFGRQLCEIAINVPRAQVQISFSQYASNLPANQTQLIKGKLSGKQIGQSVDLGAHFYFCGPMPWMESLMDDLEQSGVARDRLHWESFGSASTAPTEMTVPADTSAAQVALDVSTGPAVVHFAKSGVSVSTGSEMQSLLELAEESDVPIDSGCRTGSCGTCVVRMLAGKVHYRRAPQCHLEDSEILPCIASPNGNVELDL